MLQSFKQRSCTLKQFYFMRYFANNTQKQDKHYLVAIPVVFY